jgi:1-acyl-sn-glycerol-3-phosphate acyltransferase
VKHPVLAYLVAALIVRLLVRPRYECLARLPPAPVVIAANHLSWIDPPLVLAALGPRHPVVFIAAREHVAKRPALHRLLDWAGLIILVDRGSIQQREILRAADAALARGASLALFPEGRVNTTTEPVAPLEPGAALIARRAGVTLVPLGIAGSRELHFGRRVSVRVGQPLQPGTHRRDDDATTQRLREALRDALPPTPPPARWQPGSWLSRLT